MSKEQYPPQLGLYNVKYKSEQSTHSWQDFDMARLQISVGQEYHNNEKFEALINWCKPRFERVQVCVNDTLQRFNLIFEEGLSETEAYQISKKSGRDWIDNHAQMILDPDIQHIEIKRWDIWKNYSRYNTDLMNVYDLYETNKEFQKAIDDNILDIWKRRTNSDDSNIYSEKRFSRFKNLSKIYLLEEITVFSRMFELDEAIDIYPGTTIFAAIVFQGRTLPDSPCGLGKGYFARIDFSKNKKLFKEKHLKIIN